MIPTVDLLTVNPEELAGRLCTELERAGEALLWTARRPRKRWYEELTDYRPLVLSSAPQFEQILWLAPTVELTLDETFLAQHTYLLEEYHALFDSKCSVETCPLWLEYRELLFTHIEREEATTYPAFLELLPLERVVRELGYEHLGLRRTIETLPALITEARTGNLSRREREGIDIDFYHLLEHHLEREFMAFYPTLAYLTQKRGLQG